MSGAKEAPARRDAPAPATEVRARRSPAGEWRVERRYEPRAGAVPAAVEALLKAGAVRG